MPHGYTDTSATLLARTQGIEHHVAPQLQQLRIAFHENSLESPLEQVSYQIVATVELLGVNTVELTHALGEIRFRRLHHHMVVVGHLAIGVAAPVEAGADLPERREPIDPVLVIAADRLPGIAARRDVIKPAGEFDAQGSGHRSKHRFPMLDYKTPVFSATNHAIRHFDPIIVVCP